MDVVVLGTGSADGWPNAFCGCPSCCAERGAGRFRAQTSALVDQTLLLDCGPQTPNAAQRAGTDLTGLRHILLTHAHPDHFAPAALLFRSWVSEHPLDLVGPPEVVQECRTWVAPDSPVRFHVARAGDRLRLGIYDVRVHAARHGAAGSAVLYDVASATGRLLYATDTGPLPEETVQAVRGASFDRVLLEETFGDLDSHDTDHLDLQTFPEQVRRLRAVAAVTEDTDLVAVHLSHRNPPTPELARRLTAWGARVVDDGTRLRERPEEGSARPVRTLVLGGARSGKSREAERLLADADDVVYVATSDPTTDDPDWLERVRRHRDRRPAHWSTVETLDLPSLLRAEGPPLLVDCLTLWLTRLMDHHDAWDAETWRHTAEKAVAAEVDALVVAWRATRRRVVAVSNEVGQGVVPATDAGVRFRDVLGRLNALVAAETEDVRWCLAGRVVLL